VYLEFSQKKEAEKVTIFQKTVFLHFAGDMIKRPRAKVFAYLHENVCSVKTIQQHGVNTDQGKRKKMTAGFTLSTASVRMQISRSHLNAKCSRGPFPNVREPNRKKPIQF
jgi:hypothetical protein